MTGLVAGDIGAAFEFRDVEQLGLLAVGGGPEIVATRYSRAYAGRLGAGKNLCHRVGVGLQLLGGVVVDGFAGLGIDALGPGYARHILGGLQELPVLPVKRIMETVACRMGKELAVLAVDLAVDQDMGPGLVVVHGVVRRVLVEPPDAPGRG